MPKVQRITIDFTSMSVWKSCPRRFFLEYVSGLVRKEDIKSHALTFGEAAHKTIEMRYQGAAQQAAINAGLAIINKTDLALIDSTEQHSPDFFSRLMNNYFLTYPNDFLQPPIAVEVSLVSPLTDRISWSGKVDLITKYLDKPTIIDHKTTSKIDDRFAVQARLSDQFTGYIWLAQQAGYDIDVAMVNGLQTYNYKIKPKTGSPYSFGRYSTYRSPEEIEEWKEETIRNVTRIIEDLESNRFATRKPHACTDFFSLCPFNNICGAPQAMRESMKDAFGVRPWNMLKVEWEK